MLKKFQSGSCRSAVDVIKVVKRRRHRSRLVTFDIFDTLLTRTIIPPDRTKIPAARSIAKMLMSMGRPTSVRAVLDARDSTERMLRKKSKEAGWDGEIHIRGWARAWLGAFFDAETADSYVDRVVQTELDEELKVCIPVYGMRKAVESCREFGLKVGFISDMYLGEREICRILAGCGFEDCYDFLYVSSERKRAKHSGRLYHLMLKETKCDPNRWIHFGDREHSDVMRAQEAGAKAYHFMPTEHELLIDRVERLQRLSEVHPQWNGGDLVSAQQAFFRKGDRENLSYAVGFWILGPLLTNYIHQVIDRVDDENIQLILFPARDGFVLREIYLKLAPVAALRGKVPSEYIFLNRQIAFPASLKQIGTREIGIAMRSQYQSLRHILNRFGLDPEELKETARDCGIVDLDARVWGWFVNPHFSKFLRHPVFLSRLQERRLESRCLIFDYLGQVGFWEQDSVALVDVGWSGTTQESLQIAFEEHERWPKLFGFYMALRDTRWLVRSERTKFEGIFFERPFQEIGRAPVFRFCELFELATRAPHLTAIGLVRDEESGKVIPVLKDEESEAGKLEMCDVAHITSMQAGIFDFADVYAAQVPFMATPAKDLAPGIVSRLDRFLRLPSRDEARVFSDFHHMEDFASEAVAFTPETPSFPMSVRALREWWSRLEKSPWSEGLVGSTPFPGIVYLWNLRRLLREADY